MDNSYKNSTILRNILNQGDERTQLAQFLIREHGCVKKHADLLFKESTQFVCVQFGFESFP